MTKTNSKPAGAPRPVTWFEVTGNDPARLRAFYADVFGWRTADVARGASYGVMDAIAQGIGGGIGTTPRSDRHVTRFVEVDALAAWLRVQQE